MSFFTKAGKIESLKDGIATVSGLTNVASGELVVSGRNMGIALNLLKDTVGVVFFTEFSLKVGDSVERTTRLPQISLSILNLGEVFSALGASLGGKNSFFSLFDQFLLKKISLKGAIETKAPGILGRQSVYEPVATGLKIIDSLIPVGQGQRELIIGDRQTGKTALAVDTILNQAEKSLFFSAR